MSREQDQHSLTGAYALDALPDAERVVFEAHLEVCDDCRDEAATLQATAARLGAAVGHEPPPHVRGQIMAAIAQTAQEPPPAPDLRDDDPAPEPTGTPRWLVGALGAAAAVLLVAVGGLALAVGNLTDRLADVEQAAEQASTDAAYVTGLLAAPDATTLTGTGDGGEFIRVVVSPSRDLAVVVADRFGPAPSGHAYELWLIEADEATPAGRFDPDPDDRATLVMAGALDGADAIGVTVEPEDGAAQPTTEPTVLVDLDEAVPAD